MNPLQQTEFTAVSCVDLIAHVMLQPERHSSLERELAQRLWLATMEEDDDGLDA
jgi:hypothetical protein